MTAKEQLDAVFKATLYEVGRFFGAFKSILLWKWQ
jgi:hypothetical protein